MVLLPLSDATTPSIVRSKGRSTLACVVSGINDSCTFGATASRLFLRCFNLALTQYGFDPRDFLFGLLQLARILQFLRHRLGAQVKQVLLLLGKFRVQMLRLAIAE